MSRFSTGKPYRQVLLAGDYGMDDQVMVYPLPGAAGCTGWQRFLRSRRYRVATLSAQQVVPGGNALSAQQALIARMLLQALADAEVDMHMTVVVPASSSHAT